MPYQANPAATVNALLAGALANPFGYLGMHGTERGLVVRALLPQARGVSLIDAHGGDLQCELERAGDSGLFTVRLPDRTERFAYRFRIDWGTHEQELEDAYRFSPILGDMDVWLLAEGTHHRPFEKLGAHPAEIDGVAGVSFAVWAPNARRVSVVGDFNAWDGRRHLMRFRHECGVWEMFVPHVAEGDLYKFEIRGADGLVRLKADPFAFFSELRPNTASIVHHMPSICPPSEKRREANTLPAPISIYEVHLGSWRLPGEPGKRWLTYGDLAEQLIPYAKDLGFTHIELLPVNEHPYDASWGYQPTGLYAPTSRFGTPDDFRDFVQMAHDSGLGILLDWVPAHFPMDAHGLAQFDGTNLYEHEDPREGVHQEWGSLIYNFGRREVRNFLVGNALYWIERFGVDGLRVDAVASMLYRDYARKPGEWIPNRHGGRENLEAIDFLQNVNAIVGEERPEAAIMAEESTSFPKVSHPVQEGGLGFHFKWNLGWMHDTLDFMKLDPVHRKHHHDKLRFSLMYAFSEHFVLPLSHDEVVHCKGSLIGRMPGDEWQRFANLRAYYGFMWGHPGKKLLFMGGEFGQYEEWNADGELDWNLLQYPLHAGVQRVVRDLNAVYRSHAPLHRLDFDQQGFQWIVHDDVDHSVFAFLRRDEDGRFVIVVSNFTPVPRHHYRIGVPQPGVYREILNTDNAAYGGSGMHNGELETQPVAMHGYTWSLEITAPPLATCMLVIKE